MNQGRFLATPVIESFRKELLRWNKQINLVSRQETQDRLTGLLVQCRAGLESLYPATGDISELGSSGVCYFDLGSGGGLPGIVWHALMCEKLPQVQSFLVEPREKRAWFLNRLRRIPNMPSFEVLNGRWGEVSCSGSSLNVSVSSVLISLKALYLPDSAVLSGLDIALGPCGSTFDNTPLKIVRYYPPEQKLDSATIQSLSLPHAGSPVSSGSFRLLHVGSSVVPLVQNGLEVASLIVSDYNLSR